MSEDRKIQAIQAWLEIVQRNTPTRQHIASKYKSKKALLGASVNNLNYFSIQIPSFSLAHEVVFRRSYRGSSETKAPATSDLLASLSQALSGGHHFEMESNLQPLDELDEELQHILDMTFPLQMNHLIKAPPASTPQKGFFNLDFTI